MYVHVQVSVSLFTLLTASVGYLNGLQVLSEEVALQVATSATQLVMSAQEGKDAAQLQMLLACIGSILSTRPSVNAVLLDLGVDKLLEQVGPVTSVVNSVAKDLKALMDSSQSIQVD